MAKGHIFYRQAFCLCYCLRQLWVAVHLHSHRVCRWTDTHRCQGCIINADLYKKTRTKYFYPFDFTEDFTCAFFTCETKISANSRTFQKKSFIFITHARACALYNKVYAKPNWKLKLFRKRERSVGSFQLAIHFLLSLNASSGKRRWEQDDENGLWIVFTKCLAHVGRFY